MVPTSRQDNEPVFLDDDFQDQLPPCALDEIATPESDDTEPICETPAHEDTSSGGDDTLNSEDG